MVPRVLLELFKKGPADVLAQDLPQIMKIVTRMSRDDETMVRTDLLEQIPNIAAIAVQCKSRVPELNLILSDYLLPIVVHNLGDKDNQVRKTAHSSLFLLLEKNLVTRQQAEIQVCPTVLGLSNSDTLMDYHTGSITLMSRMVPFLGREVTERVFLQRFSQLCTSNMFCVRKVCASHFGDFCAVIGKDAYDHVLLPSYLALCSDDIWGVRKACAEVVMSVSCACSSARRRSALAPAFAKLLQDKSRWVRLSAFQTLGPFISTFADPTITSLAYNSIGELVLINKDGTEFRITPTYSESNILRSVSELHMLFKEEANKNYSEPFFADEEDLLFKPIELVMCNDDDSNDSDKENNSSEDAEQPIIYTAETDETVTCSSESADMWVTTRKIDETAANHNATDDMKNFIDNVTSKIEDITFRFKKITPRKRKVHINNELGDDKEEELQTDLSCTHVFNNVNNLNVESDNVVVLQNQNGNCSFRNTDSHHSTEDLEEYNSYKYWYLSPEMPLDLSIVNQEIVPIKDDGSGDHNNLSSEQSCSSGTVNPRFSSSFEPSLSFSDSGVDQILPLFPPSPTTEESKFSIDEMYVCKSEPPSQLIVPQILIDHFVSMTDSGLAQETDSEMAYHCAYSLPAVALTLGPKNWHLLRETVSFLAANMQYKVRRTVASSLHELAMILGPDMATSNLTPLFEGFIKDLDEVRIGVLKHLAHFLRLINPSKRNVYLPRLAGFLQTDNDANWRFRQELAEQLLLAVPLFRPGDASKHISHLAQELLCDKVAAVRGVALLLVTELIRHVSPDPARTSRLLVKLAEMFAHSKRWKLRQSFALLCSELLTSRALLPEQFASEVMPHLLDLSWDPVPNVRLVVARTIAQHIVTNEYFADPNNQHYDGLQTVLRRLQSDKDRDVREYAVYTQLTDIH